jgi:hypothetical protein
MIITPGKWNLKVKQKLQNETYACSTDHDFKLWLQLCYKLLYRDEMQAIAYNVATNAVAMQLWRVETSNSIILHTTI